MRYNTLARDAIKRQKLAIFRFEFVDYTLTLLLYQFFLVCMGLECSNLL